MGRLINVAESGTFRRFDENPGRILGMPEVDLSLARLEIQRDEFLVLLAISTPIIGFFTLRETGSKYQQWVS